MPSSPSPSEPKPNEPNPNSIPEPEPNPNAPPSHPQTTANKPPPTVTDALGVDLATCLSTGHGGDLATGLSTAHGGDLATSLSTAHGGDLATGLSTAHGGDLATGLSTAHGGDLATGLSTAHGGDLATGLSTAHGGDLATGLSTAHGGDLATGLSTARVEYGASSEVMETGTTALPELATAHGASSKLVEAGIANMGNTSFMSAILQCFTHTVPLLRGLRCCPHVSPCDVKGFCVICAFRNLFDNALNPSKTPVVPRDFAENLDYFIAGYVSDTGKEEDAHEFLQCAMKELQKRFPVGEENLIDQVFGGSFVNTLRCCLCGRHSSATFLPFTDMSLEIEHAASIPHALKSITRAEQLDGKFRCTDCNQEVTMEKQRMLDKAPSVAVFHLKRFLKDGDSFKKIERSLWLHKNLNLNPYTSGSSTDNVLLKYELYAVVAHRGPSPNSGHYFCFVRSAPDEWYLMDDDKVSSVSEKEALNRRAVNHKAYILFYAKEGTPLFSSILEKDDNDTTADPDEKDDDDNNGAEDDNDSADASYNLWFKMGERSAQDELCECYNM